MSRKLAFVAVMTVVSLVGALAANAGTAKGAAAGDTSFQSTDSIQKIIDSRGGALNKIAIPNFNAETWQPTESLPLPVMESPIVFRVKDEASYWFDTELYDAEKVLYTRSLGVGVGPTRVTFFFDPETVETSHTATSIAWPEGAANMPYSTPGPVQGVFKVDLIDPGLYVWNCQIHPYMIPAVVIDDPTTPGADFGKKLRWVDGKTYGSAAHEILHVVRVFFTLTGPLNWQHYPTEGEVFHDPSYPHAPVMTYTEDGSPFLIPNLDAYYQEKYNEGKVLKAPVPPTGAPGIGEIFSDVQWEHSKSKTKPGGIAVFDASTWTMAHKWFVPEIDLNNPHNQWSSADGNLFFVTNWYGTKMATLDAHTGKLLHEISIGPAPSHIVSRNNKGSEGNLIIPNNGGGRVSEVTPDGSKVIRTYMTQKPGSKPALPHGHWVSPNGKYALTPNTYTETASIINMIDNVLKTPKTGEGAVAAMITGDSKRGYITNLLSSDMNCFSLTDEPACPDGKGNIVETSLVDFRQNYDPITGKQTGPKCLLPIQLPIAPNDKYMGVVCTGSADILVIDLDDHKLVKNLPCGPGCHGGNFGLKKGGGYYTYYTVKFANRLVVTDLDPNNDGDPSDAMVAGHLNTNSAAWPGVHMDDEPSNDYTAGQGGNGVEMYPASLNGWVQNMPKEWQDQMTCQQRNPLDTSLC